MGRQPAARELLSAAHEILTTAAEYIFHLKFNRTPQQLIYWQWIVKRGSVTGTGEKICQCLFWIWHPRYRNRRLLIVLMYGKNAFVLEADESQCVVAKELQKERTYFSTWAKLLFHMVCTIVNWPALLRMAEKYESWQRYCQKNQQ